MFWNTILYVVQATLYEHGPKWTKMGFARSGKTGVEILALIQPAQTWPQMGIARHEDCQPRLMRADLEPSSPLAEAVACKWRRAGRWKGGAE